MGSEVRSGIARPVGVVALILAFAVVLSAYYLTQTPSSSSPPGSSGVSAGAASKTILVENSGWCGVECMITPLSEYVRTVSNGTSGITLDVLWPFADSSNPLRDAVERGAGLALVSVLSADRVEYDRLVSVNVVYSVRIERIIVMPRIDPSMYSPEQLERINTTLSSLVEGGVVEVRVPAFLSYEAAERLDLANLSVNGSRSVNLSIDDVASPFPLLEPGYTYLVLLRVDLDGIHVFYDYVWGPWAYMVVNSTVYSLDCLNYTGNITLDPLRVFDDPSIRWLPYPYEQLRSIAIEKLSACGVPLQDFIEEALGGD